MADSNGNGPKLFLGGVLLGLGVAEAWRRSTTKTSRMEKEEPELVAEVMEHLEDLLDDLVCQPAHQPKHRPAVRW